MSKLNVSIILPIASSKHKNFEELFGNAVSSVSNQKVKVKELLIVHSTEESLVKLINNYDYPKDLNVIFVENKGNTNFQSQVNLGVNKSNCDFFSILEFDDEYSSIWFKNVKQYMDYYDDVDIFMPIVADVDNKGVFVGFTNEASFASNINNEVGTLNEEMLLNFQNFQSSGAVFNKNKFINFGGFKTNFKLTFVYELFLRMVYNGLKTMTIPKIGYKHVNLRENSIFWNYKNSKNPITQDEAKFWIDSAKEHYKNTKDEEISFTPQEQ